MYPVQMEWQLVATLLYKMGREGWLERFLDVKGTENFILLVGDGAGIWKQLYVKRRGSNMEVLDHNGYQLG